MGYRKCLFFLVILLIMVTSPVLAGKWYTMKTDHFIINFQKDNAMAAYKVSRIAEDVHDKLIRFMEYEPVTKTYINIFDDADMANGSADVICFNRINVYLRKPDIYSGMVGYSESWLRLVITHEYTHILHLDMNEGASRFYRHILGKIPILTTPNILQPWWLIEGYTTYTETKFTNGGRGKGDIYSMYIRTAALQDKLYSVDKVSGKYDLSSWPTGGIPVYIYGLSICRYIAKEYGEDKLVEISHKFCEEPQEGINKVIEKVLGIEVDELYKSWKFEQKRKAIELNERIETEGRTEITRLTEHGYFTLNPSVSPDGKKVAYYHYYNKFSAIRILTEDGRDYQLVPAISSSDGNITWSPDGKKLVYAKQDVYKKVYNYYDLYMYDFTTDREIRLTRGERAYAPVFKDNNTIIYLTQDKGITSIKKIDLKTRQTSTILKGNSSFSFSSLDISPDGNKAVLSVMYNSKKDLYLYSFEDKVLKPLIDDNHIEVFPVWSPDGKYVVFSSDRNGRFNLYALDMVTKNLYRITNLFTGAFKPSFRNKDEIVFVGYSLDGYDLYSVRLDRVEWKRVGKLNFVNRRRIIKIKEEEDSPDYWFEKLKTSYRVREYSPFPSLYPKYIMPNFSLIYTSEGTSLDTGFTTYGKDALEKHSYSMSFNYHNKSPEPSFDFQYSYQPGTFLLSLTTNQSLIKDGDWVRERNVDIMLGYPLINKSFYYHLLLLNSVYHDEYCYDNKDVDSYTLYGTGWRYGGITGSGPVQNSLYWGIDSYWKKDNIEEYKVEMSADNYLELNKKTTLAGRLIIGYNKIDDFSLGQGNLVRAFREEPLKGSKLAIFNLELRKELINIESGPGVYPVFYDDLNGTLFYDFGLTGDNEYDVIPVVGGELGLEISQLYGLMNLELVLGFGHDLEYESSNLYIRIGKYF
ncbi:PD40 domain-containing protein [Halothermothrix orenii]|uniref:PD40 domain-containing protein n=1 Tax=Halothermothrix orenii TaxID=31909 RepID=UPI0002EFE287|nr:PD40 domain-containing protein [Halothermothrix orenii]